MSEPAIKAEGLSKSYRIGGGGSVLSVLRRAVGRSGAAGAGEDPHTHWALRDVSFQIAPGEVVGIIGRNGAGKSTLLKILSRITSPSAGRAMIRGRVSSLLEVGTGFHPELTGRENIYMNGAILGMSRTELAARFDQIVEFSGVERFLDTPLKRYSSGMQVRLAFAVAAHLEPEILIVDEVLAVGDAAFQRKCLGKMESVSRAGRTVVFVSHNMAAVQVLCSRGIVLGGGRVVVDDRIDAAVGHYLQSLEQDSAVDIASRTDRRGRGTYRLVEAGMCNLQDEPVACASVGEALRFRFRLDQPAKDVRLLFALYDHLGQVVVDFDSKHVGPHDSYASRAGDTIRCDLPQVTLAPGRYRMNVAVFDHDVIEDHVEGAVLLEVQEGSLDGRPIPNGIRGSCAVAHRWTFS